MTEAEYDERIATLKSRYSYLFAGQHLGHDIAPGWLAIVEELCHQIDEALTEAEKPAVKFVQLKEKLGGLRVYLSVLPLRIDILGAAGEHLSGDLGEAPELEISSRLTPSVREAEEKSLRTCVFCGAPGQLRTDRDWILTLCDKHATADDRDLDGEFEELTTP